MRKALLLFIPAVILFTACSDRNSSDVFVQLKNELKHTDASFFHLYGSVIRVLVEKAETTDFSQFAPDESVSGDLSSDPVLADSAARPLPEGLSGIVDNMKRIRIFRQTEWSKDEEILWQNKITEMLEERGSELLISTSIRGGNLSMFLHDDGTAIDRFYLLMRLPDSSQDESQSSSAGNSLLNTITEWTSSKSLLLVEVDGSFEKEELGRLLMEFNNGMGQ